MKLEVENKDIDLEYMIDEKAYWVAGVMDTHGKGIYLERGLLGHAKRFLSISYVIFIGYYVLLRYEGFGNDKSGDFWTHLCSSSVHHVGWCANKGKPLIPPKCKEVF
jgi:hypothetical protein